MYYKDERGILAQNGRRTRRLRWLIAASSLPLFGFVAAFGIAPDTSVEDIPLHTLVQPLTVPELAGPEESAADFRREETVVRGDTLGVLLARLGVQSRDAATLLRNAAGSPTLRQLVPGRNVSALMSADGGLIELRYLAPDGTELVAARDDEGFAVREAPADLERRTAVAAGEIVSSLFGATDAAGVPDSVAIQLAEIFGSDIDFHRDIRRGDRFAVVYEQMSTGGLDIRAGRVLAAEFTNDGKTYRAVYFEAADGQHGYYTPEGKSMRKAFLRSPLEFSRISSGFSNARYHPVLKEWRAHRGIDYAAPTGTRVRSTADGRVAFAGVRGGYGRLVVIQHAGSFSTAYGHLSRFAPGLRVGSRVSQGDTIGYVGMTGLATGPHLHYEFRVNGEQRDPLRVALPVAFPVPAERLPAFRAQTAPLASQLDLARQIRVASAQ